MRELLVPTRTRRVVSKPLCHREDPLHLYVLYCERIVARMNVSRDLQKGDQGVDLPRNKRSTRLNAPQWTGDIWLEVFEHLSTRQWATAAGTCKASWNVQPACVSIEEELPVTGEYLALTTAKSANAGTA